MGMSAPILPLLQEPASLQLAPPQRETVAFADEVGSSGPVICVGGMTQWHVGRRRVPDALVGMAAVPAREVRAPAGVVRHDPEEMIVRVLAGTTAKELDAALGDHGQHCPLDPIDPMQATVGGVLAVGHSGIRRLRYGHVRDTLLEARYVAADGQVVKAGAPVVKNVTGYDLCRLLVGSLGTLGFLSEVVLRCTPKPVVSQWYELTADPWAIHKHAYRPSSVLWDGQSTWILLEGRPEEVKAELDRLRILGAPTESIAPPIPTGTRLGTPPARLHELTGAASGSFLAEIGVGVVHLQPGVDAPRALAENSIINSRVTQLNVDIKRAYDPSGRMNPGVQPW
jgi:FAD/FMN-containing dehydrogenase